MPYDQSLATYNASYPPLSVGTVIYTIVLANAGPASANNAVVRDEPEPGLHCTQVTCSAAAGAVCPAPYNPGPAAFNAGAGSLGNASGVQIPAFPGGSSVTFSVECGVTATGL